MFSLLKEIQLKVAEMRRFTPACGMRGLTNYCLSCCVNTLLQMFSATWEFADLLHRWEAAGDRVHGGSVPFQLRRVLVAMRGDLPQPTPHRDFLHCLHENGFRLRTQHDANEVFLAVLELVKRQMDDQAVALQIQNLFRISVETNLQCLECNSIQTLSSYLLSLPLHIKDDHNTLEDCLTTFFDHEELREQNGCLCPRCETKTSSRKGMKLCSLPRILCIHLERFRNIRGFTLKLDCRVTFPEVLDLSEILKEAFAPDFAESDCSYSLYAVVVHSGFALCGHYTAYVRDKDNRHWYYADDSRVQQVTWESVAKTYGGSERGEAYMLMYRRNLESEQRSEVSG